MKILFMLRHGKSSWDNPKLDDHDRPLKKRGRRDAPRMGKLLKTQDLVPDLIVSSTAERAFSTAELVAEHCGYGGAIQRTETLYHGSPEDFVKVIAQADNECDRVMIVGHNPGLEELLRILTGRAERLPTAALARVNLPIANWRELTLNTRGTLDKVWRPKELEPMT